MEDPPERLVGTDRVLAVLSELARHPEGATLDQIASAVTSPKPTVHRGLLALRRAGFAQLLSPGRYLLGDQLIHLAFAFHEARPENVRVQPILEKLCKRYGETAHYAVLDQRSVVYRAKLDPDVGAARLTSIVGGRNPAHVTAVGKMLLAYELADEQAVRQWVAAAPLAQPTARTRTDSAALARDLEVARQRGYAIEDEESEPGVACLAVPVFLGSPTRPTGAISVAVLTFRRSLQSLIDDVDAIKRIVNGARLEEPE